MESLIDMRYLNGLKEELGEDLIPKLTDNFIQMVPQYVQQAQKAFDGKDYYVVALTLHKIKQTLAFFGLYELVLKLEEVYRDIYDGRTEKCTAEFITEMSNTCLLAVDELARSMRSAA